MLPVVLVAMVAPYPLQQSLKMYSALLSTPRTATADPTALRSVVVAVR
jgi:hypothetical protein